VCDACNERLAPVQRLLAGRVSNAAQVALHDVTDPGSSLRAWLNNPLATSLQEDIFKATSTLRSFDQIGRLKPEKGIPDWVLSGAKGLAIITVFKIGFGLTYKLGTGLVVARREDGSWSAPSAIGLAGLGYGPQLGGELTDFVIVLRTSEAVKAFTGRVHLSVGAGLSVAAGPLGRSAEADVRAGLSGTAACLSYSCSKGMFVGLSVEGSVVATRTEANARFYGDQSMRAREILLGDMGSPRAAAPLYAVLEDLFAKVDPVDCLPGNIYDEEDE
jgi:lipid-binding SYLF domain-containing protein